MSVQCQNLSLKNRRATVFDNLTFELPDGQITALYGPTGSGKTALLLILAGLLKPSSGDILLDGFDVRKTPRKARRQVGLGVIPEFSPLLSKLTLEEQLLLHARTLQVKPAKARVQAALTRFELEDCRRTMTDDLPAFVSAIAGLALALLNNPTTLLLDEPEHRLTSEERVKIWELLYALRQEGKCIIVSTRYQEVAAACDKTLVIPLRKVVDKHEADAMGWDGTQTAFA